MEHFEIVIVENGNITVFTVKGYFEEKAGKELAKEADRYLQQGRFILIIDFAECLVISSPGIAALIDLALLVIDDYKGRVILSGLDRLKTSVLSMSGVIPLAEVAPSIEDALKRLSEG